MQIFPCFPYDSTDNFPSSRSSDLASCYRPTTFVLESIGYLRNPSVTSGPYQKSQHKGIRSMSPNSVCNSVVLCTGHNIMTHPPITSKTKPAAKKAGSKGILTRDLSCTNNVCILHLVVALVLIPLELVALNNCQNKSSKTSGGSYSSSCCSAWTTPWASVYQRKCGKLTRCHLQLLQTSCAFYSTIHSTYEVIRWAEGCTQPTLLASLYCAEKWSHFWPGEFVIHIAYQVFQTIDHLNKFRSKLWRLCQGLVDNHVANTFSGDTSKIKQWAHGLLNNNGGKYSGNTLLALWVRW